MYTIYDEYELLELFECEPTVINEDAEIYLYNSINEYGFEFKLYLSIYDMNAVITLTYKDVSVPIFDISICNVKKIDACSRKLSIYTTKNDSPNTVVFFDPSYRLELSQLGKKCT